MANGVANHTAASREFLQGCPAVVSFDESDPEMIRFKFDQGKYEALETIPEGVYFDMSEAPF